MAHSASGSISGSSISDEREFEGGFVLDPKPGCYKGVVVIDGDSLYGSIMSGLGIFIDRCTSSRTAVGISERIGIDVTDQLEAMNKGDVTRHNGVILMKDDREYRCIIPGLVTIVSMVQNSSIADRKAAKGPATR